MTILYYIAIIGAFTFYFYRFFNKDPIIQYNAYSDQTFPDVSFNDDDFHVLFFAINAATGKNLTWNHFWPNLNLYAATFDKDESRTPKKIYTNIPFIKCADTQWIKTRDQTLATTKKIIDSGICLDETKVDIFEKNRTKRKIFKIDLYPCQTNIIPMTCKNYIPAKYIEMQMYMMKKTVKINNYENPITEELSMIKWLFPSTGIRYQTTLELETNKLHTNRGAIMADYETNQFYDLKDVAQLTSGERSVANIKPNYASQGRLFNDDLYWHVSINVSNSYVEITRNYFN